MSRRVDVPLQLRRLRAGSVPARWRSELGLTDGLAFSASVDQAAARLLAGPEGKRTLGDVARDLEPLQASGLSIDEESVLPVAREMLAAGFLDRG